MKTIYSIGSYLNGQGIGYTAAQGIMALRDADALAAVMSLDLLNIQSKDAVVRSLLFDGLAAMAEEFETSDAYFGWASMCFSQLFRAKANKLTTFIPATSTYPTHQQKVLLKEQRKFNIEGEPVNQILLERMVKEYKAVDYILASSEIVARTFEAQGLSDKIELVEHGVDTDTFKPDPHPHDDFHVVFVGGNWLRKGVFYLLKAWSMLDLKDARLTISTNVPTIPGVDYSNIKLGFVDDIMALYHSADVFVFPTLEEGKALAVGEAMACGVPVIITEESGWVIEDYKEGITVKAGDSIPLVSAIRYFYDNPTEVKKMGAAARAYAEKHTWAKYRTDLVEAMERHV